MVILNKKLYSLKFRSYLALLLFVNLFSIFIQLQNLKFFNFVWKFKESIPLKIQLYLFQCFIKNAVIYSKNICHAFLIETLTSFISQEIIDHQNFTEALTSKKESLNSNKYAILKAKIAVYTNFSDLIIFRLLNFTMALMFIFAMLYKNVSFLSLVFLLSYLSLVFATLIKNLSKIYPLHYTLIAERYENNSTMPNKIKTHENSKKYGAECEESIALGSIVQTRAYNKFILQSEKYNFLKNFILDISDVFLILKDPLGNSSTILEHIIKSGQIIIVLKHVIYEIYHSINKLQTSINEFLYIEGISLKNVENNDSMIHTTQEGFDMIYNLKKSFEATNLSVQMSSSHVGTKFYGERVDLKS